MIAEGDIAAGAQDTGGAKAAGALRAVLRDGSDGERCLAARALGRIGDRQAVAGLVAALRAADPDLRADAAEALRDLGDPGAADQLLENLIGDPEATVKLAAIAALAGTGDRRVIPWLGRMVRERDPEITWDDAAFFASGWDDWTDIQAAAVAALADLRALEAVPDIVAALAVDDGQDLTETAFGALARMGPDGLTALAGFLRDPAPRTRRRAAAALAGITGPDIAAPLAVALDDPAPEVRLAALCARARVAPADPLLAQMIFDPDPGVRAAALGLAPAPDPDVLAAMLDDPSDRVRVAILTRLADPAIRPGDDLGARLAEMAGAGDGGTAAAAALALAARDPERARRHLVPVLADPDAAPDTRLAALRALAGLEDAGLCECFAAVALTATGPLRAAALAALAGIARRAAARPDPAADALLAALGNVSPPDPQPEPQEADEPVAPVVAEEDRGEAPFPTSTLTSILARNRPAPARPRRVTAAAAARDDLRILAARVLGGLARPEIAAALAAELAGTDADLALAAAEGLARIAEAGTGLPADAVRALLAAADGSPPALRCMILRALGPLAGMPEAGALLHTGLADADPGIRAAAAAALATGGCGAAAAVALGDPDDAVRLVAARAVAAAGDPVAVPRLVETALSGTGQLARPVARLLRRLDAPAANAALTAILADPARRRDRCPAIEALEELNRSRPAEANPARPASRQNPEV